MEGGGKGGIRKKKIGNKKTGEFTVTENEGNPTEERRFLLFVNGCIVFDAHGTLKGPQNRCC